MIPNTYSISTDQLEPVVSEPLVQAILKVLSHSTMLVICLQRLLELVKQLDLISLVSKMVRAYTNP